MGGVPAERDAQPLQTWSALPCAWPRLAAWRTAWRLPTVVMASTGVDGMPRLHSLEARGCAGALVQARHVTNVPGRPQTERCDSRGRPTGPPEGWVGRRRCGRLRPAASSAVSLRQRAPRIPLTVKPRQPRHPSLAHMPLPLHPVLRARTRVTGRRMLRALVAGRARPADLRTGARLSPHLPSGPHSPSAGGGGPACPGLPAPPIPRTLGWYPAAERGLRSGHGARPRPLGLPWSILPPTPAPHRRPPLGPPNALHPPLLAAPLCTGSRAWLARPCRADKP